ncbi:TraX family protein [Marinospirillum sp.]|uniref:TraX family protein n=1 Tax=Marinospirillum sp. TaxID=2183934 RepID=UPI00286FED29|nr:TraX family protein [Marinospirillum sp.]MDR9468216.1 TraX family protein [Marinospirillum sp.]
MPINNLWIPLAQWLAVISMTADHSARYLVPGLPDYYWVAGTLGRLAFPFFAALVAWHALFNSRHLGRYSLRILMIGLIAQPVYAWMLQEPLSSATLNVCFTLAGGLGLTGLLKAALQLQQQDSRFFYSYRFFFGLTLALICTWLIGHWVDYGLTGLLLIPAFAGLFYCYQQRLNSTTSYLQWLASWSLPGFLALGLNPPGIPTYSSYFALLLLLGLLGLSQFRRPWQLPFPRWLWLSWYPLHLLVIAASARLLA